MTRNLLVALLLSVSFISYAQVGQIMSRALTSADMVEDFRLLRKALTESHPGLYRYSSKDAMNQRLDSLENMLSRPMDFASYYRIISLTLASSHCAHTYPTPTKDAQSFFKNIKTFPLMIMWAEGKYVVTVNGTTDSSIKPGFELVSINGEPVAKIRQQIAQYLWADGYNETFKKRLLNEQYFPSFYYNYVARPETFTVVVKDDQGKLITATLPAQTSGETSSNFTKNSVNRDIIAMAKKRNARDAKGWRLEMLDEKTAFLRFNSFGNGRNEKEAQQKMHDFMEDCMKKINRDKVKNMVIDLRYNGGGWDMSGVELLSYLIKQPTKPYRRLYSVANDSEFLKYSDLPAEELKNIKAQLAPENDGTFTVKNEAMDQLKIQQPKPNAFNGKIYILVNGGTASAASEFTAYTKAATGAIVVGEETGGGYEGGNSGSFINLDLPKTGIHVSFPLLAYVNEVPAPAVRGHGTMPDVPSADVIADMLSGKDTQMEAVLKAIAKPDQKINEPQGSPQWSQPYEPFRIVGNVYHVGTYDLACYLITTPKGHILINTGLAASLPLILKNIETLGFKATDLKVITTTQAHYDHVGAIAALKNLTGARVFANTRDAAVLEDGGMSDYEMHNRGMTFSPIAVDRQLNDNDVIELGEMKLTMIHHPGHTKGSCSFVFDVKDGDKTYKVLIANMPTIVTERKLSDIPEYPAISKDIEYTLASLKKQTFDIYLSSHASQFDMHKKHKPGDAYNPQAFVDRAGYDEKLKELEEAYKKKLEQK